ncbi:malto-oligosyltrehalose trehalohydrolase [Novosphingobium sp. AP12]|uniref:malto-oligosyltrehalose trehalohydrolase n=1 Tax=Novosphingobium sp. AP12 TaxID=1144305 RepID=UPI0002720F79|nr:malto-oligosyltrehalose trehalohydrolase [Novosphingobium sp. AP12]EJL35003.1 malto-oligosyltrehalose trehalohydrolase [Novosphingobium sp. AP12]
MATQVEWGARPIGADRWRFGLWAPDAKDVGVELGRVVQAAQPVGDGWWSLEADAAAGDAYRWVVGGTAYPDPAARAQVGDVHGPSKLVDPAFEWRSTWGGRPWLEAVIYELHLGTFTDEGTLAAAQGQLVRLCELGVTVIELMPVAQFDGHHGWGYDGVLPYAPHPAYGSPEDLRAFVDAAHDLGMSVLLDVVYNHFGPAGNYLGAWCPAFFHAERSSPWGDGIAFETPAVREFFIANALHWLEEYRFDGLRLDAVHAIEDHSQTHFLDELGARIRARDWDRPVHLVTEDERNLARYFTPEAPFDATWNDDWHHAVHCLLTGEDESYYAPFAVDPIADIAIALADGYIEQGQSRTNGEPRGEPSSDLPNTAFINFLCNHDQVGNRAQGERLHQLTSDPHALRVATALTLLSPFVPMLFMGDEFLTDAPFLFFADFSGDLAEAVRKGRAQEFARFSSFGGKVPDPITESTFLTSKIGAPLRPDQNEHEQFVHGLLALRSRHVVPLLARNRNPISKVSRNGSDISAQWSFASGTLSVRVRLGKTSDDFEHLPNAFFKLTDASSPFAFSATVSPE